VILDIPTMPGRLWAVVRKSLFRAAKSRIARTSQKTKRQAQTGQGRGKAVSGTFPDNCGDICPHSTG